MYNHEWAEEEILIVKLPIFQDGTSCLTACQRYKQFKSGSSSRCTERRWSERKVSYSSLWKILQCLYQTTRRSTALTVPYLPLVKGVGWRVLLAVSIFRTLTYMQMRFCHQNELFCIDIGMKQTVNQLQFNYSTNIFLLIYEKFVCYNHKTKYTDWCPIPNYGGWGICLHTWIPV